MNRLFKSSKEIQIKATPEYTMEAATTPMPAAIEPPTRLKTKYIMLVLLLIFLLVAGGIFASKMLVVDPEAVFYETLENHMSTKYIGQRYTTDVGYAVIVSDTKTDFSNPAEPKTVLHDTYKVDGKIIAEIESITTGTRAEYGKIMHVDSSERDESIQAMYKTLAGKWLKCNSEAEASLVDPYGFAGNVNQTQGEFLVGNYPAELRRELLTMYRETKVFTFDKKKVKTERLGEISAFKYDIKINKDALSKVNRKAEEKLGLKHTYNAGDMPTTEATVWIDKTSKKVVRVLSKALMQKTTVDITYPDTLKIVIPEEAKTLDQLGVVLPQETDTQL
ncbi:hypothetical protein IPL85_01010 [Candidatus Saccharibacteria bacterium]|nr:MAG: hypothetical protein IPL85_01010 [Candidatus Saccharibacteria bacterium]